MVRGAWVLCLVILGCSGARPPEPRHPVPIGGLPPREATGPEKAPSHARVLARLERRFETVRITPPHEPDPLARGPRSLGHQVDLELARAPIGEAFRFLADAANVNLVMADGIDGQVTLRLRRVTVRDALRALAATQNLETELRGNILWVRRVGESIAPP